MCGVAGLLSLTSQRPERAKLARMSRALAHRGPDGWGIEVRGPCGLAHRRLSIIDLSEHGKQPMTTGEGRLWLSFNGEIYNYLELRAELEEKGATFHSATDSEVILAAYREWGVDAFARFNGMWGLALWDDAKRELLLSRDRLGVKPLNYHRDAQRILFASEVKAMIAAEPRLARPDPDAMARFLEWGVMAPGGETQFQDVRRVTPGTVLFFDAQGRSREERFWRFRPPARTLPVSREEAAEKVRALLIDAVRLRFRSDVPVGTCLSGGIDSSAIVSIATRELGKAPETFSAIYPQKAFDEGEFVRAMVQELKLSGHQTSPDGSDIPAVMTRSTYHQEEPTAGPGVYSQWHVMKLAGAHVRVLLDGQGADEIFGGYFFYLAYAYRGLVLRARAGELSVLPELWHARQATIDLTGTDPSEAPRQELLQALRTRRVGRLAFRAGRAASKRLGLLGMGRKVAPEAARAALRTHPAVAARVTAAERSTFTTPAVTGDPLRDLLWDQLTRTSIPGLLHYEDRNSMAFSIEARVPFLDYRLVELACQLPPDVLIHRARTKLVLREAMRGILPEVIRGRRDKKGYPTPFGEWIRSDHVEWIDDLLLSARARERGLMDPDSVRDVLAEHRAGTHDHGWALWKLLTIELFSRRYFDGPLELEPPPARAVLEDDATV